MTTAANPRRFDEQQVVGVGLERIDDEIAARALDEPRIEEHRAIGLPARPGRDARERSWVASGRSRDPVGGVARPRGGIARRRIAVAAAAGRLHDQRLAGVQARASPWPAACDVGPSLAAPDDVTRAVAPSPPPGAAVRADGVALAQQRDRSRSRRSLQRAHEAAAAAVSPVAGTALGELVARDAQRKRSLEYLDRRVERVGHVRLDRVDRRRRPGARPSRSRSFRRTPTARRARRCRPSSRCSSSRRSGPERVPARAVQARASTRSALRIDVSTLPAETGAGRSGLSSVAVGTCTSIGRKHAVVHRDMRRRARARTA